MAMHPLFEITSFSLREILATTFLVSNEGKKLGSDGIDQNIFLIKFSLGWMNRSKARESVGVKLKQR
jgi:hypothetical protein